MFDTTGVESSFQLKSHDVEHLDGMPFISTTTLYLNVFSFKVMA
jgi:hypothetical protein